MKSEYLLTLIYENIKDGATTIYVKYIGLENFVEVQVDLFIGIEFDCFVYKYNGSTITEKNYIPVDKIVHISFEKRITFKELID